MSERILRKFKLKEIDVLLSQINKRAKKDHYKVKVLRELKKNLMYKTEIDLNNPEQMIFYKDLEDRIQDLEMLFNQTDKYFCLNCSEQILFEDTNYITTCECCNWRNEFNDIPAIDTIITKVKVFEDYSQIAYPLIEKRDLEEIPLKLKEAIVTYFKTPAQFSKNDRDNIYHNLYKKDALKFEKIAQKYKNKAKLVRFFQDSNLFK